MSRELDLRIDVASWLFHVFQLSCCTGASNFEVTVVEREAEVFASLGQLVQLAGRNVITQTVNLVVGCPDVALWSDGQTSWIAHAFGIHGAARAVQAVVTHHAANTDFFVQSDFVFGLNVVGLAQGQVDLAIFVDFTNATSVVERLLFHGNQFAFRHNHAHCNVWTFVEVFSGREVQHAVGFSNDQETVFGEANAIGVRKFDGGCKCLDFSCGIAIVAVGHSPHGGFTCTDEQHVGGRSHCHVTCVRHNGVQLNLEAFRQLDFFQVGAQLISVFAVLWDGRDVHVGVCVAHALQGGQVFVLSHSCSSKQSGDCQ